MAPIAKRVPHTVKFGRTRTDTTQPESYMTPPIEREDPYYWIRDDTRQSEEVLDLLQKENAWTKEFMDSTADKQEQLYQLYKSRIRETYESCRFPRWTYDAPYEYFYRMVEGKGYPIHYRNPRVSGFGTELLLDLNKIAEGHSQCDVRGPKINSNHDIMAYGVDYTGDECYQYHFFSLGGRGSNDKELPVDLPPIKGSISMLKDTNDIIYTERDEADRSYRVWHYDWTTKEKTIIYEDLDHEYNVGYSVAEQNDYLLVYSGSADREEVHIFSIPSKLDFTEVAYISRDRGLKFNSLDIQNSNCVYVTSTYGDPSRHSLYKTTLSDLSNPDNWIPMMLPVHDDVDVNYTSITRDYIIVNIRQHGINRNYRATHQNPSSWVEIIPSDYNPSKGVLMGHITSYYDTKYAYYSYETTTVPDTTVVLDLESLETKPYYVRPVPNYDQSLYESKRISIKTRDGTDIPLTVSQRRDTVSPAPVYLYGYGSYGISIEPRFNAGLFTILDQGFIHVVAHVRGGGMLGESWHLAGKMHNKLNTFNDFIDTAQYLRDSGIASKIVAEGRSAGGMLMGVVYTKRPELFDCVIAGVPFVDCLNTMQDSTIPLTCGEWKHWGNPNIQEDYEYILKYSPYDNISTNSYPPLLMLSGFHDHRVAYWEPAKFVSKLRFMNPELVHAYLKTELERGHFGNTDRYRYLREKAHDLAFVLKVIS